MCVFYGAPPKPQIPNPTFQIPHPTSHIPNPTSPITNNNNAFFFLSFFLFSNFHHQQTTTEVAAGEFVQPSTGKVVSYDHVTGKVGATRDATEEEIGSDQADTRAAIQKAVEAYLKKAYQPGDSSCSVTTHEGAIQVVISAEKIKHDGGCWSGRWKSEWNLKDGNIDGTVTVMSHYYEEGNVQMHNLKDVASTPIDSSDAEAVAKHIEKSEAALHKQFDKMYNTMTNTTFKELRRQLPITGMKFNWTNSGAATMRQVLTSS